MAGRYEIIGSLGAGGMGTVYRARDVSTGAEVALKMLHPQYANRPHYVRRFEREAEVACRIGHPNVCRGLDRGTENGVPFFTMDIMSGRSVAQIIEEDHIRFGPETSLKILAQAAAGLAALTSLPDVIAHRDLSSANIFVDTDGAVRIADFGIAKLEAGNETGTGSFLGNVNYMSPEQINDPKRVDVRSDIYTLGVVFYEMLAGTRPFDGSPTEIANKHLYSPAPTLKVSGHLAEACTEILGRTLAKNPADRFQSPQELARFASALVSDMQLVVPARTSHALSGRTVLIASVLAGTMLVAGAIIALGAQPGSAGPGATTTTTITPPPVTTTTPRPPTPPLGATWSYSGARDAKTIPLTFSLANIDSRARAIRVVTTIGTTVFSGVATSPSIKSGAATVTFDISGLRSASAYQFSAETYATAADAANAVTSNRLQAQPVIPVLKGLGSRAVSAGGPVGSSGGSVKIVPRPPQART